jgi:hypothetical protein
MSKSREGVMAEIKVPVAELRLATVKLTPKVFKQLKRLDYGDIKPFVKEGNLDPAHVVGWIHGAAVGDEWKRFLLIKLAEGEYGTFEALEHTCKKHKQIFLS